MATDKSEPKTALIAGLSLLTVVLLGGVREGLRSYFIVMHESEVRVKVIERPSAQLSRIREAERNRLTSGPVTIDQAFAQLSSGPRPAAIEPRPSNDLAPLQGWSARPANVVSAHPTPAPAAAPAPTPAPTPAPAAPQPPAAGADHAAAPAAPAHNEPPAAAPAAPAH